MKRILFLFLSTLLSIPQARSAPTFRSEEHAFHVTTIVQRLEHPWSLAFLPDGRMLVTERPGRLRVVAQGKLDPEPIAGLRKSLPEGRVGCLMSFCILLTNEMACFTLRIPLVEGMESG